MNSRPDSTLFLRLSGVVLLAAGLDVMLFHFADFRLHSLASAHMASFAFAAIVAMALSARICPPAAHRLGGGEIMAILALVALVMFLRGGLLAVLSVSAAMPVPAAQAIVAAVSLATLCAAYAYLIGPLRSDALADAEFRDRFIIAVVACSLLLRLLYLGQVELIFEEAYYWNYAQHPDIGYLDHPLMVAWTIKLFISLFGDAEFAVRSGALLFWFITAYFSYRLTSEIFDRAVGRHAVMLVAALPIFFSFGWFISPDAPLAAFWSMALYFAYRIVQKDDRRAWLGFGLAIGLGASSKYTVFLLVAAFGLYVLADRQTRQHLLRREPYIALLVALLLFSPVIIWNLQNDLASFAFQSQARLASNASFSLPRFILNVLVNVTPTGVMTLLALLLYRNNLPVIEAGYDAAAAPAQTRDYRLLMWLCLFPVAVFGVLSLTRTSKLNWTGPAWLALLPLVALLMSTRPVASAGRLMRWSQRAWPATVLVCLVLYGALFHYLSLGLPGAPYPHNLHLIGWRDFGPEVERLKTRFERETGEKILVVGMDRNRIASGLAFYRDRADGVARSATHPALDTASVHLFGDVALMYERWFPVDRQNGKTMLLIGEKETVLESPAIRSRVESLGEIHQLDVRKNGRTAGRYYYRLVRNYHAEEDAPGGDKGSDN